LALQRPLVVVANLPILGMLTVTFFGRFSVCFSSVFTANSNIFAGKTDEKQNEKQSKNSQKTLP
jgi:hypothetical protein